MPGPKTNEREGTRAVMRYADMAPNKVREVLDLVRGRPVHEAEDILRFSERDAAQVVGKVLHSAASNARENDELEPEELYVSACFADEGPTAKRWRPRARGRATRIRKRTTHITVIVSRLPARDLERLQARRRAEQLAQRARRVAGARQTSPEDTRNRAERRRGAPIEPPVTADTEGDEAATTTAETEAGTEAGAAEETGSEDAEETTDAVDEDEAAVEEEASEAEAADTAPADHADGEPPADDTDHEKDK